MKKVRPTFPPPPHLPAIRYDSIVGTGGMSVVWRAWHDELKQFVAVKVLSQNALRNPEDAAHFMQEVRLMAQLNHPGIVRGYGGDVVAGQPYYMMEFMDGYTMGEFLARKGALPEEDVLIIAESVADAMRYAWNQFRIVHCDLKPDNLMVNRHGAIKVMDLGISQTVKVNEAQDVEEDVVGTPAYMSPEQILGTESLDCRADIYSLGALLYHLAVGRLLFPLLSSEDTLRAHVSNDCRAADPRCYSKNLSVGFVRFLSGLLVKDRTRRYQTWEDVLDVARAVAQGSELEPLPRDLISSIQ